MRLLRYSFFLASVLLLASACQRKDREISETADVRAPKVEFSVADQSFTVDVDSIVDFGVNFLEGSSAMVGWWVDGEKVATTPDLTWVFSKLGLVNLRFEAENASGKVVREWNVTVLGIPLEVEYSIPIGTIDAVAGTPVEVSVTVTGGDKGTVHSWTLDGVEAGNASDFTYTFDDTQIGTHTLVYYGVNTDELSATKTWTITVIDLPLELEWTPSETNIESMETKNVNFSAKVIHGATGISFTWFVDNTQVATGASYTYECTTQGSFTVRCDVKNEAKESASCSWNLTVTERTALTYMLLDANTVSSLPSFVTCNNVGGNPCVRIENNPLKSATYPLDKVFIDDMSPATWANSGVVSINTTGVPASERYKYTKVRIKVYIGANDYVPYMYVAKADKSSLPTQVNGTDFYPDNTPTKDNWDTLIKHDDWNVLEWDINKGNYNLSGVTMADIDQIQFRLNVVWNNSNAPVATSPTNNHIIYFNEIEFVE